MDEELYDMVSDSSVDAEELKQPDTYRSKEEISPRKIHRRSQSFENETNEDPFFDFDFEALKFHPPCGVTFITLFRIGHQEIT